MSKLDNATYNNKIKSQSFLIDSNKNIWLNKNAITKDSNGFHSFHLEWEKMDSAKSYAIVLLDYEASRVIGQNFVHWTAANIKTNSISHKSNILDSHKMVQGVNSTCPSQTNGNNGVIIECIPGAFKAPHFEASIGYFPPMPPDKPHLYQIRIYGLDVDNLELNNGYFLGDLFNKMSGHVVGLHTLNFWSNGDK